MNTTRRSSGSLMESVSSTSCQQLILGKDKTYYTLFELTNDRTSDEKPCKSFIPNSHHNSFHKMRWNAFLSSTPEWILKTALKYSPNQTYPDSTLMLGIDSTTSIRLSDAINDKTMVYGVNNELQNNSMSYTDWSLQLENDGELRITGRTNENLIQASEDISHCERVDANRLKIRDGTTYVLVGMPDHYTSIPYYVRNKFQCGFPHDWKQIKMAWTKYVAAGSPSIFDWTEACRELNTLRIRNLKRQSPKVDKNVSKIPRYSPRPTTSKNLLSASQASVSSLNIKKTTKATTNANKKKNENIATQIIVLTKWTPFLDDSDLKVRGYIESTKEPHISSAIEKRKTGYSFQCKGGKIYNLKGPFEDSENTVPSHIKKKLDKGLPAQWKCMINSWNEDKTIMKTKSRKK